MKCLLNIFTTLLLVATLGCHSTVEQIGRSSAPQKTPEEIAFDENLAKAKQGDAEAQYNLGKYYAERKNSLYENSKEASKWLKLSVAQGYEKAKALQIEIEQSEARRGNLFEHLKAKAEGGDAEAQEKLGGCYQQATGVARDLVEAVKYYHKAAEQNYAPAQCDIGRCYEFGIHDNKSGQEVVLRDLGQARRWYRKAAEQNYAPAQYSLGYLYFRGFGGPQDYVSAYFWEFLAFEQGVQSVGDLNSMVRYMTPSELNEAKQLAHEFQRQKEVGSNGVTASSPLAATGTGFFITENGYLISNYHVVKGAAQVRLITSVGLISAKVVRFDAANDLALLKAEGQFSPLPITSSRAVKLGGTVATVGFPDIGLQGFAPKFGRGEISSLSGAGDDARYFQISVPLQPGNSGGALVDERGNVVGVVSAKLDAVVALTSSGALPENVNYAVKSSFLLSFLESAPEISAKLKEPFSSDRKFVEVVQSAQQAAVLVLVY